MAGTTEYKNNWQKEHLDRINLTVPKGQKETFQAHATAHGESVTAFIQRAIYKAIERDHAFDERESEITELAKRYNVSIEDREELKNLVTAFAALEPIIPNVEGQYFSNRQPQKRAGKIYII